MAETTSREVPLLQSHVGAEKDAEHPRATKATLISRMSTYALDVSEKWIKISFSLIFFTIVYITLAVVCLCLDFDEVYVESAYGIMAVTGLLYRVKYYLRRKWILYFIDLCFMGTIVLTVTLVLCRFELCSQFWFRAIYIILTGPIPGATFMLQLPMTFHHPEAFESWFLHATPMWLSYARRWKWHKFDIHPMPTLGELVWDGVVGFYVPWVLPYVIFLLIQPFLPCTMASYQTLMDLFMENDEVTNERRLIRKKEEYFQYYSRILAFVLGHAILSASGALAGALSFQSWHANILWIICVQIQGILSGFNFYARSAGIVSEKPAFIWGFLRMAVAWLLMVPTWYCSIHYA